MRRVGVVRVARDHFEGWSVFLDGYLLCGFGDLGPSRANMMARRVRRIIRAVRLEERARSGRKARRA